MTKYLSEIQHQAISFMRKKRYTRPFATEEPKTDLIVSTVTALTFHTDLRLNL